MREFKTNCEAHSWPEPNDGWCPVCIMNESDDVKRQRDQLREALEGMLDAYTQLVNCGDCGNWNPEHDEEVVDARAALAATEETAQ